MSKTKVKTTPSKHAMKRLIKAGYELQGVSNKRMLGGQTLGGQRYILVKPATK